jgi:hypothetical protein
MHRDTGHETASHLVGYELTGSRELTANRELTAARNELRGIGHCVGIAEVLILNGLLSRQLRELLGDPLMVLRQPLELLLRLLKQCRVDLLGADLRLLPSAGGLAGSVCGGVDATDSGRELRQRVCGQLRRQLLQ